MSKVTVPPPPASIAARVPQPAPATASPQPAPSNPQNEVWGPTKKSASRSAKIGNASNSAQELAQNDELEFAKAKPHATITAPPPLPPASLQAKNASGLSVEREEGLVRTAPGAGNVAEPAPRPIIASAPAATNPQTKGAAPQTATPAARSVTQGVAVLSGLTAARATTMGAAKSLSPVVTQAGPAASAQVRMRDANASSPEMKLVAAPPEIGWSISSDGKVQRSTDGGKSFGPVAVAPGIKFQAVAALDKDVWAGGADGALFHSPDRGASWTQAGFNFQGAPIIESITAIQIRDAQHLVVTTDSGTKWVSEDSGQSWQKQS